MTGTSIRALWRALIAVLAVVGAGHAAADPLPPATGKPHLAIRLVADSEHPRAGSTVTVALATVPEAGWHGYWRNPGDAGFAGDYQWTLPAGVRAGAVQWPVPTTLLIAGLMNYVYEAPYAPLVDIAVPAGLAAGTRLPIGLEADYLVCTQTLCVPEKQTLRLDLTVGDGAPGPGAASFAGWRRAIPKPLGAAARFQVADGTLRLGVPFPAAAALDGAYFFPITTGAIDYAAPQAVSRDGDRLVIATKGKGAPVIDGVLRIGKGQGLAIRATPGPVAAGGDAGGASVWATTLLALAGAVLGGLILNIMPCVFPILSLKALSLARGGGEGARAEALAYTAGVVLVCVGLGAAILALRAGGSAVGWAFQLQDPRALVVLLLLSVAIALNLAGLFEVPTPRFAGESGRAGAFATGALAAFVATPCTGPFMGAALGAALVLPTAAALAVFAGLGVGLALPFLLIGFVPALRRRLPRPGGWMETFRRILSVPMWLTAIALAWVLGRQAGTDGMTDALLAALLVSLLLWVAGRRQASGRAVGAVVLALLVATAALAVWQIGRDRRAAAAGPAAASAGAERFSEARLADLRRQGRPVFAYFTADWCLTCKVNERSSIETAAVREAFRRNRVAVLEGDWTDGDAGLGRFIQAHNRAGVPLYLFYPANAAEPQVLPQVLTPAMLEGLR